MRRSAGPKHIHYCEILLFRHQDISRQTNIYACGIQAETDVVISRLTHSSKLVLYQAPLSDDAD
jgi:hypothetical protein